MSGSRSALTAGIGVATLTAALMVTVVPQVSAATGVTFYASPTGTGSMCSQASPCSLAGAQSAVRSELASTSGADVTVLLQDGTPHLRKYPRTGPGADTDPGTSAGSGRPAAAAPLPALHCGGASGRICS
jgi:hypothetical protein